MIIVIVTAFDRSPLAFIKTRAVSQFATIATTSYMYVSVYQLLVVGWSHKLAHR